MGQQQTVEGVIKVVTHVYFLEKYYGASGQGLHERINCVEEMLSRKTIQKLRYIATIRNKVVHEYDFHLSENERTKFINTCEETMRELQLRNTSRREEESSCLLQ
jgi:hypothetical protein